MTAMDVLVVDDSPVMRKMVIRTLQMCRLPIGHIREAGNGIEGLRQLEANEVDLILTDINMPEMDGARMIQEIRGPGGTAGPPILIISTGSSETIVQSGEWDRVDFIGKPFTPEAIRDKIIQLTGVKYESGSETGNVSDSASDF